MKFLSDRPTPGNILVNAPLRQNIERQLSMGYDVAMKIERAATDVEERAGHSSLRAGGWSDLSLMEQLGNAGSEINRALKFKGKSDARFESAIVRALELLDPTLADRRWKTRLKEIARTRELLCAAVYGGNAYGTSLDDLNKYLLRFALAAQLSK